MDLTELRAMIPQLESRGIYLDSAATSLKPRGMIRALDTFYSSENANIHRSPHLLGQRATERYESVRDRIKEVFRAHEYEVVFTRGATEALNIVIAGVARSRSGAIVTSMIDHHSSFVACQQYAAMMGRPFRVLEVKEGISSEGFDDASLISIPMVSNVTGEILNYERIVERSRKSGALCLLDASQAAPHLLLDCDGVGADAYALSAHKMLGPTGLGILIAKRELLESIDPLLFGGEMVGQVSVEETSFAPLPLRFEAGTMPIAEVIAFSAVLDIFSSLDRDEVELHRRERSVQMLEGVMQRGFRVLSAFDDPLSHERVPTVSFVGSFHPYDAALLLDSRGIAVRSGHHCAEPFHTSRGVSGSLRASAYLYTTRSEIDRFLDELEVIPHA